VFLHFDSSVETADAPCEGCLVPTATPGGNSRREAEVLYLNMRTGILCRPTECVGSNLGRWEGGGRGEECSQVVTPSNTSAPPIALASQQRARFFRATRESRSPRDNVRAHPAPRTAAREQSRTSNNHISRSIVSDTEATTSHLKIRARWAKTTTPSWVSPRQGLTKSLSGVTQVLSGANGS